MNDKKKEYKKVGKVILGTWILTTLIGLFYPYAIVGWPTPEQAIDWWGVISLVAWGYLLGWFFGWVQFVWEPSNESSGDE